MVTQHGIEFLKKGRSIPAVRTFIAENYQMAETISAISELSKAREDTKARSWFGVSYLRSPRDSDYRRGAHAA